MKALNKLLDYGAELLALGSIVTMAFTIVPIV